ncbi:6,7-dimethyl-8-ribityllumazine synthase [Corynebacterium terpenotabidum]|uniref:6,7-dimethyl-8-ribityllumazine synthase n=1 Tax=Corynebacterium terpenotabidum Y-11 TaxID=1200352 RepID=S4XE32_9CORY|nr:6,7-dimethyl-8-ribityllumazine synthase [Corynebacterium terpenotabidum]AGP30816.1 6,7-dimethyl-8-ribityllumazine synthase [Corynebacterium terpenotabidum Y-11]
MPAHGLAEITLRPGSGEGFRLAVISASWNAEITDRLHDHAVTALKELGASVDEWRVAGCVELPVAVQEALTTHDAVVATGCVIRGETAHFDYVCQSVTDGLTRVALDSGKPVGNGVLTVENQDQAVARSGVEGASEDKGADAARAALHTLLVLRSIRARG